MLAAMSRRLRFPGPQVVSVALAAVVVAAGCSAGDGDRGGVVDGAKPEAVHGKPLWVQVPTGRVSVTVGEPTTTIPAAETRGGSPLSADDGHTFVPVKVQYDEGRGTQDRAHFDPDIRAEDLTSLTVEVDGEEHRVPFDGLPATSYVDVHATELAAKDVVVAVDFDGVTQRVSGDGTRETGEAAGLYELGAEPRMVSCGEAPATGPSAAPGDKGRTCVVGAYDYPYILGLGWASERQPGHTWTFVTARTWLRADEIHTRQQVCERGDMRGGGTLRVDRATAEETREAITAPSGMGLQVYQQQVFLLPTSTRRNIEVERTYRCEVAGKILSREVNGRARVVS